MRRSRSDAHCLLPQPSPCPGTTRDQAGIRPGRRKDPRPFPNPRKTCTRTTLREVSWPDTSRTALGLAREPPAGPPAACLSLRSPRLPASRSRRTPADPVRGRPHAASRRPDGFAVLKRDSPSNSGLANLLAEVAEATRIAKDLGLKVCYHVMPGLPGAGPEKDVGSFRQMFDDPRFRPDMIKIYPTLVVKGTKLHEDWSAGRYEPYTTDQAVRVIAEMKALVPEYVRIQRIQRDIPVPLIEAGVDKGHLRELVKELLARQRMQRHPPPCRARSSLTNSRR